MSTTVEIKLEVPEALYRSFERIAAEDQKTVEEYLTGCIEADVHFDALEHTEELKAAILKSMKEPGLRLLEVK